MTFVLSLCWPVIGLLVFILAIYRQYHAHADGRTGVAPLVVDIVFGAAGLWLFGATVYFGLIDG